MSSPFRSAAAIIVRSIAAAMRRRGGGMPVSIPQLQPDPFGSKAIHYSRPAYDHGPTRNCRRHQICKVRLAMEEYRRRLERVF
jgi:hypothetical protein